MFTETDTFCFSFLTIELNRYHEYMDHKKLSTYCVKTFNYTKAWETGSLIFYSGAW